MQVDKKEDRNLSADPNVTFRPTQQLILIKFAFWYILFTNVKIIKYASPINDRFSATLNQCWRKPSRT